MHFNWGRTTPRKQYRYDETCSQRPNSSSRGQDSLDQLPRSRNSNHRDANTREISQTSDYEDAQPNIQNEDLFDAMCDKTLPLEGKKSMTCIKPTTDSFGESTTTIVSHQVDPVAGNYTEKGNETPLTVVAKAIHSELSNKLVVLKKYLARKLENCVTIKSCTLCQNKSDLRCCCRQCAYLNNPCFSSCCPSICQHQLWNPSQQVMRSRCYCCVCPSVNTVHRCHQGNSYMNNHYASKESVRQKNVMPEDKNTQHEYNVFTTFPVSGGYSSRKTSCATDYNQRQRRDQSTTTDCILPTSCDSKYQIEVWNRSKSKDSKFGIRRNSRRVRKIKESSGLGESDSSSSPDNVTFVKKKSPWRNFTDRFRYFKEGKSDNQKTHSLQEEEEIRDNKRKHSDTPDVRIQEKEQDYCDSRNDSKQTNYSYACFTTAENSIWKGNQLMQCGHRYHRPSVRYQKQLRSNERKNKTNRRRLSKSCRKKIWPGENSPFRLYYHSRRKHVIGSGFYYSDSKHSKHSSRRKRAFENGPRKRQPSYMSCYNSPYFSTDGSCYDVTKPVSKGLVRHTRKRTTMYDSGFTESSSHCQKQLECSENEVGITTNPNIHKQKTESRQGTRSKHTISCNNLKDSQTVSENCFVGRKDTTCYSVHTPSQSTVSNRGDGKIVKTPEPMKLKEECNVNKSPKRVSFEETLSTPIKEKYPPFCMSNNNEKNSHQRRRRSQARKSNYYHRSCSCNCQSRSRSKKKAIKLKIRCKN